MAAFNAGKPAEALGLFDRALTERPKDRSVLILRAHALAACGRGVEAAREFQALRDPAAVPLLLRQGRMKEALSECLRALERDPSLWAARDVKEALAAARRADPAALARRLDSLLRRAPAADGLVLLANLRLAQGRGLAARARLRRAARLVRGEHDGLADCAERLGDLPLALRFGDKARRERLRDALAAAAEDKGDYAGALRLGSPERRARLRAWAAPAKPEVRPGEDPESLTWTGEALRLRGQARRAEAALRRALRRWPMSPSALANLILTRLDLGLVPEPRHVALLASAAPAAGPRRDLRCGRLRRGAEALLKLWRGNRTMRLTVLRGGKLRDSRGSDTGKEPLRRLQGQAVEKGAPYVLSRLAALARRADRPGRAQALAHRGEVLLWLGRYGQARRQLAAAADMAPELRWPPVGLAAASLLLGRPKEALARLERAEASGAWPTITGPWKGEALRRLGRLDEARRVLGRALESQPGRVSVLLNLVLCGEERLLERARAAAPALLAAAGGRAKAALALMKGNRSSWLPTFVEKGRLRRA